MAATPLHLERHLEDTSEKEAKNQSDRITVKVRYFAALKELAGTDSEVLTGVAPEATALYEQLKSRYGFALSLSQIRLAVDGVFCNAETKLLDGQEVAFLPPVSGG